ncbi:hypothetical protein pEaSNUABM50_00267 [Erwinia phage pEa_SNUABM_50]|uniref:Uncharacterized protein n=4 Tax=Eneladusvirus BF TaxID=2560751 RepID=A0A7L8ZNI4_9CAUD|nr:hypothetical protein FDH34_gp271 [Serratia phage BF]QOI71208.1 hypothetical protein pEaSNUABM12_00270 [Erwinia phage pEa_SNUABM_12]QOI71752.1 hypothetical protein pEaSNUABM47_00268 [Erwinia phage pEa_SNUABM_47]QOI72291.1 hypothetical protein pEaSNUABM50_00267 [Erwinia phage pEa_SNUABM_50]QXO11417.1 hypothetical protein pEaSNUABM19_00271 [Erwinia phage pEa_SNUABM_19]QXO11965.1 hypothetical protein pEaSNUABM44_00269 [Erwinia phage pEa_SNUABM_44]QXO12518.1 hypothetical protein pEaSNUABM49_002
MAILKILTDYSFIVETNTGEKMGILVNYDEGTTERTGIEFFNSDGSFKFDSMSELQELLGEEFTYAEIEVTDSTNTSKGLGDYPINDTDNITDILFDDPLGIGTFRKSARSKKRFYPGWWIVRSENGSYLPRLTISVDIYNERNNTEALYGPFKSYMDVTYTLKQL